MRRVSLARKRNLAARLETLERRHLLAGNVLVSLLGGELRLEGDDLPNVVSLQAQASPDGTPGGGAFVITPDATTSLNDLPVGTPLTIDRVSSVSVSMGGGDDRFSFQGSQGAFVEALHVETGAGADLLEVDSFEVRGLLSVSSTGSSDHHQVDSSQLGQLHVQGEGGTLKMSGSLVGRIDKSSPLLFEALTIENTNATLSDVEVHGSARISSISPASLHMQDCPVSGVLSVEQGGGSVVLQKVTAHDARLRVSPPDDSSSSSIHVEDSTIERTLLVAGHGRPGIGHPRATLDNVRVGKYIDKSSPLLYTALIAEDVDLTVSESKIGGSAFISNGASSAPVRIDSSSVSGSLSVETGKIEIKFARAHTAFIEASSVSISDSEFDRSLAVVGAEGAPASTTLSTLRVQHGDFVLSKQLDKSSPLLAPALVVVNSSVTASLCEVGGSVVVSNSSSRNVSIDSCETIGGLRVTTGGGRVSVSQTRAADMFIKIGGIKGEAVPFSSVVLDRCVADYALQVHGGGGTASSTSLSNVQVAIDKSTPLLADVCVVSDRRVTVSSSSVGGAARLSGSGGGTVVVAGDLKVSGALSIDSSSSVSVSSSRAADIFIKIGDIEGEAVPFSSVVLDRCDVGNSLRVDGGGGTGSFTLLSSVHVGIDKSSPLLAEVCVVQDSEVLVFDSSVSSSARFSSSGGGGRVSLDSSSVGGSLSVDSSSIISLSQCSAADVFLKIEGIKGEAVSHSSVSLDRCDVGGSLHVAGGTGDGSFTSLSSVRVGIDKSTPLLAEVCVVEGRHVSVSDLTVEGSARFSGPGAGSRVSVSGASVSGGFTGDGWNHLSLSESRAADVFIKIGGIKGESSLHTSVMLDRCDIDNTLQVAGGGTSSSSTSLSSVRVGIDKSSPLLAEVCVVQDSHVVVTDSSVHGSARFTGGGGSGGSVLVRTTDVTGEITLESGREVLVSQSSAAGIYIKIEGIEGESVSHSSVVVDRCDVGQSLEVHGGNGTGSHTSLSSVRVGIDKSTPVLAEACVVQDRNVSVTDLSVHGSARFSGGGGGGRVSIHDSSVSSTMSIDDWQDASVSNSSTGYTYIKIGNLRVVPFSSVVLDSCVIDNSLEVYGGGGTGSFTSLSNVSVGIDKSTPLLAQVCVVQDSQISVSSSSLHGSVRLSSGGGGAGKVSMSDLSVSGALSVSSSSSISLSQARAADVFLKIEGIQGESLRQSSVVLDRCDVDNTLVVHGGGGPASFTSLSSVHVGDSSNPVLSEVCVVTDRQVLVHDSSVSGSARFSSSSSSGGRVSLDLLSVASSLSVESSKSVSVSQASAGGMFIKIEGIDGEAVSRSSVVLDRCDVDGALEIRGGGGTGSYSALFGVRVGQSSDGLADVCVVQDRNIVVGDLDGDGHVDLVTAGPGGQVFVTKASVSGVLSVSSSSSVSVSQSRAADMYIKIGSIEGEAVSSSSVVLDRCVVDGSLRVQGGGGPSSSTVLSGVSVAIDKSTPKLMEVCVVQDQHVSISDSSVNGSARLSSVGAGGRVVADGLSVTGLLRASSSSSLSLHRCVASTGLVSISEQSGQAAVSSLSLESCVFDQALFVVGGSSSSSSTSLRDVQVGPVTDSSSSLLEEVCVIHGGSVSIIDTEVVGGARVSSGEGGLSIDGLTSSGAVRIHSTNGSVVAHKVHASSATLSLDSSSSSDPAGVSSPPLQLHLVDSVFDGDLTIEGSDAPDLIVLDHLHVGGLTWLEAGDGDDVLQVLDSAFDDLAVFDGGPGQQDRAVLEGNQFAIPALFTNWEQFS